MEKSWMNQFAGWVSGKRGRWITLLVWVIAIGLSSSMLPQSGSQKNDAAKNLISSMPSVQAEEVIKKEFPSGNGIPALLTWYRAGGVKDEDLVNIQALSKKLADNPLPHQIALPPLHQFPLPVLKGQVSKDGTTLIQTIIFDKASTAEEQNKSLGLLKTVVNETFKSTPFETKIDGAGLLVRVTGPVGISVDATALFSGADVSLLIATTVLVLVFLLAIYRSPVLALVPLIAVGFAYGLTGPLLGWMAKEGWIIYDSQSLSIMTVLLFGAGTDYCLFLVARFRSLLKEESNKTKAMFQAIGGSAGAIAMSGLTVVVSLLALLLAEYGSIQRFAVPFSLSILIMMIASLTLVPAMLAILGRASFFPFIPRTPEMLVARALKKGKPAPQPKVKRGLNTRIGELVVRRPVLIVVLTVILLGGSAGFATQIKYTFDTLSSFPKDMPSREGFTLIGEHFSQGGLAPVQVIVETDGKPSTLKEQLAALPYISKVSDPQKGKTDPNILSYDVEMNINPYSNEAMDHIPSIRATVEQALEKANITDVASKVWIAGQTAIQYDSRKSTNDDAMLIIPVVIGMIALLLLVYLRSVIAMIYLMLTVLLSYFSALGVGWLVVHYFFEAEAISGLIPLYAFVFLVALGEDYNIFMVSSIWQKSKVMPLKRAIAEGVAETGSVITSAGLILAGTFAVLATLPIQVLVQFGTITAIGVLLDTFIVRPFLVPAITVLLDKWAFWPGKQESKAEQPSV